MQQLSVLSLKTCLCFCHFLRPKNYYFRNLFRVISRNSKHVFSLFSINTEINQLVNSNKVPFQEKTFFCFILIYCFEQKCKNIEHPRIVNSYEVLFQEKKIFCFFLFTVFSKVSISSTFYACLFHLKMFQATFP